MTRQGNSGQRRKRGRQSTVASRRGEYMMLRRSALLAFVLLSACRASNEHQTTAEGNHLEQSASVQKATNVSNALAVDVDVDDIRMPEMAAFDDAQQATESVNKEEREERRIPSSFEDEDEQESIEPNGAAYSTTRNFASAAAVDVGMLIIDPEEQPAVAEESNSADDDVHVAGTTIIDEDVDIALEVVAALNSAIHDVALEAEAVEAPVHSDGDINANAFGFEARPDPSRREGFSSALENEQLVPSPPTGGVEGTSANNGRVRTEEGQEQRTKEEALKTQGDWEEEEEEGGARDMEMQHRIGAHAMNSADEERTRGTFVGNMEAKDGEDNGARGDEGNTNPEFQSTAPTTCDRSGDCDTGVMSSLGGGKESGGATAVDAAEIGTADAEPPSLSSMSSSSGQTETDVLDPRNASDAIGTSIDTDTSFASDSRAGVGTIDIDHHPMSTDTQNNSDALRETHLVTDGQSLKGGASGMPVDVDLTPAAREDRDKELSEAFEGSASAVGSSTTGTERIEQERMGTVSGNFVADDIQVERVQGSGELDSSRNSSDGRAGGGEDGASTERSSPEELAQRLRDMEAELLRKLVAEEDAKSLLDIWVEKAREFVLMRTVPPTDAACDFNWSRLRCEPKCSCGARLRFGDYTPGRSCRLLHHWERSPDCENTWDPSDQPALTRLASTVVWALGSTRRAYNARVAPPTDSECTFDAHTRRCEPQPSCRLQFRWGDISLSSACRLVGKDHLKSSPTSSTRAGGKEAAHAA